MTRQEQDLVERQRGRFQYSLPGLISFGPGCIEEVADLFADRGFTAAHLVTTRSLLGSEVLRRVNDGVGLELSVSTVSAHAPITEVVDTARAVRAAQADVVVALGGGSAIDTAKLAALLASDPRIDNGNLDLARELLAAPPSGPVRPVVCVPTTLGGAELGAGGGFTDDRSGHKGGAYHPSMLPTAVYYDAHLGAGTPAQLWLSTGIRALDHAVELLASPDGDPVARALAESAIADLFAALPRYRADPTSATVRHQCQVAAWKAYTSPGIAASGLSHQLSRAIGASNQIAHGVTACVVLPQVTRWYEASDPHRLRLAGARRSLGLDPDATDPVLGEALEDLVATLGLPNSFTATELDDDAADGAVQRAIAVIDVPRAEVEEVMDRCRAHPDPR